MDPMLQGPQLWYDEMSPYTAHHYSKPEPISKLTLNQLTTNDEGDHYICPPSCQSTSSSIPTISPALAQSEDEPSNADSARVTTTTAAARQAVNEADTPIAHERVQSYNVAVHPPLQCHLGSAGHPHQPMLGQQAPASNSSTCGATSVVMALANRWLKPKLQLAAIQAKPSHIWPSWCFSWLQLSWLSAS
jgi:hypothetical protein